MSKASALALLSLALSGCAVAPQAQLTNADAFRPAGYAWDGAGGPDPNSELVSDRRWTKPRPLNAEAKPAAVAPENDSRDWRKARDGMADAEQDSSTRRALVICRGCLPSQTQDDGRMAKAAAN